ncbi:putative transposon-encoded protein [Methanohalophilus levihalophilus]|uniref:hypothetical protein n=1 Tax=Methanohalophilus levihalophilus TaxID=1431282 RepID=UPI001AE83BF8|nr:hypothetical protein [Methanohalophilus levihalophilus]MBP2029366.1 putative transposon-encoded protein [Methanohalophilus levihalophilus]
MKLVIMSNLEKTYTRTVGKIGTSNYITLPAGFEEKGKKVIVVQEDENTLVISKNATIDVKRC